MEMTSNRPYLLRAFYEWIVDNNCTPYLVVDATYPTVKVPTQHIQNGQIVLNISPGAVGNLQLGNDAVTFNARFGGQPFALYIPIRAALAIYARENGAGTMFSPEEDIELAEDSVEDSNIDIEVTSEDQPKEPSPDDDKPKKGNHLRVVK